MKKGLIVIGIIILIMVIGGLLFIKQKDNSGIDYNGSLPLDEQIDYVGEQTTIFFKDFRAIMKADWTEIEDSSPTYTSIRYLPPGTDEDDFYAEYILIIVAFLGDDNSYTIERLLEQGIENSRSAMPDFNLTNTEEWDNDHFSGKKIKFTGTEAIKRNFVQVAGIKFNKLYSITYSCPEANCNYYAIYNYLIRTFEPVKAKENPD